MAVPVIKGFRTAWLNGTSIKVYFAWMEGETLVKPEVGDLAVILLSKDDDDSMSSSHGFTAISQTGSTACAAYAWYKILDSDDVERGYGTFSGDYEDYLVACFTISGFDSDTPIDIYATTSGTSDAPQAPSINTIADTLVFAFFGADGITTPYTVQTSGWLERHNEAKLSTGIVIATKEFTSAGATGVVDFTMNASEQWAGITLAINPEATASASGVKVKASGTWKDVTAVKMKISGTWTTMTAVKMKISGVWETIM